MFDAFLIAVAAGLGTVALPLGLLPSVLLFRDLADGVDDRASAKRAYAIAVWGGLAAAWLLGWLASYALLSALFG